jgi:photosystem II stability/assembly factor-like uncharacterized protein
MISGRPLPGLRRRHVLGLLTAGAALGSVRRAFALDIPAELSQPAVMTPAAAFGLFNNVVTAGNRMVAVGERGRILLSDNAGQSWRQAPVPVSVNLVTARFATPSLGWAAGQMGVILKTQDAGESWKLVLNGFQAANLMLAEARAAAPGKPAAADDGTAQTPLQAAQLLVSFGACNPILSLVDLSPSHILAFGAFGLALESLDGGETWRGIGTRVQNPQGLHIYGALRTGDALLAAGEGGLLLRGAPDGPLAAGTSPYQGSLFGLVSLAADNVIAFGLQGTLLQSTDLGATWRSLPPVSANAVLCGQVLQGGRVVFGDASGNMLLSKNQGVNFSAIPGTLPVTALGQAPDGALVLASPAGLRRVMLGVTS